MRILFITSTRLGDAVLSTGLLRHALTREAGSTASVVCGRLPAPLFSGFPGVERVIIVEKRKYAAHWFDVLKATIGTRWDWIIDLRNVPLLRLLRARRRDLALRRDETVHKVVELGRVIGEGPLDPWLPVSRAGEELAEDLLPGDRPTVAFGPTAANPWKEWSHARFVALAGRLVGPNGILKGARLAILGAEDDRARMAGLIEALEPFDPVNLMGATDPLEAVALMRRMRLFIGNDSGLMHIAATAGTPTLGLFGPGFPVIYGPWGPHTDYIHRPVDALPAAKRNTNWTYWGGQMSAITITEVAERAALLLERTATKDPVSSVLGAIA